MSNDEKKKIHPGFMKNARNIGILLLVIVAIVAALWLGMRNRQKQVEVTEVPQVDMRGADKSTETERYSQVLQKSNDQGYRQAAKTNTTFIPVISDRDAKTEPLEQQLQARAAAAPADTRIDYARLNTIPADQSNVQAAPPPVPSTQLSEQVQRLAVAWGPNTQTVSPDRKEKDISSAASSAVGNTGQGPDAASVDAMKVAAKATEEKIFGSVDWVPGHLITAIDTDKADIVLATIDSGKYAGSTVSGSASLTNELVSVQFATIKLTDKRTAAISAVALQEKDMSAALSGKVNRRYLERVGIPALLGATGAAGAVYSNAGATVTNNPIGGTTSVANPNPTAKQVFGAGAAGGMQAAQKVIEADTSAIPPKQVTIPADTPIWIYFKSDVVVK